MPTILISGAASGIGKAFVEHYAQDDQAQVIAIDRSPINTKLHNVRSFEVDVSLPDSISTFARAIGDVVIDLVIHSAGIRGLVPSIVEAQPGNVAAAETMEIMDAETMMKAYQVNAIGTFLMLQALMGNLTKQQPPARSKVVVIGSRMGSISYNSVGGGYAYRASKAALNAIVKSFSIDVPNVIFTTLHPGRVETGLVASREEGAITVEESLTDMLKVIGGLGPDDSGKFYDRFGKTIGW